MKIRCVGGPHDAHLADVAYPPPEVWEYLDTSNLPAPPIGRLVDVVAQLPEATPLPDVVTYRLEEFTGDDFDEAMNHPTFSNGQVLRHFERTLPLDPDADPLTPPKTETIYRWFVYIAPDAYDDPSYGWLFHR